jgi:hypothetical protein
MYDKNKENRKCKKQKKLTFERLLCKKAGTI